MQESKQTKTAREERDRKTNTDTFYNMHESGKGRGKHKAAEELKEQLNVEPDPISACGELMTIVY